MPAVDDETTLMAEQIGALREELASVRNRNQELELKIQHWRGLRDARKLIIGGCGVVGIIAVLLFGASMLYHWIATPDVPTHCEIKGYSSSSCPCSCFALRYSIPWKFDRKIGNFPTVEAALEEAKRLQCKTAVTP